jgi:diguanylate cyclase (GGDEF)-like protein/PAS domain S-box-containing protein
MDVLVAEDDPLSARILRRALESLGHSVTVVTDGESAWDAVRERSFRIVISDWMMPRLDGVELCRRVRAAENESYTYIMLLTSRNERDDRIEALQAGVDDFLSKPLDRTELEARMRAATAIVGMQDRLNEQLTIIAESEHRYRTTFELLDDIYYQTDRGGRISLISPSCERHTGYTPEELVGTMARDLFVDGRQYFEILRTLGEEGRANDAEATIWTKDGRRVPVSVNASHIRDSDGSVRGLQCTIRDITDRRRSEESIRASEQRNRALLDAIPDMMFVVDTEGTFLDFKSASEWSFGLSREEVVGCKLDEVMPGDMAARVMEEAEFVLGTGESEVVNFDAPLDDRQRHFEARLVVTGAHEVLVIVRDITEAHEARQLQEALRAEAEYAARHDPLTGLLNRRAWNEEATSGTVQAVALFDIDHFKSINDTYGHQAGDDVLEEVARRMGAALGDRALLGRIGGEEFGALFEIDVEEASQLVQQVVDQVASGSVHIGNGSAITVTLSAGLSPWVASSNIGESLSLTYGAADRALYQAKHQGRNRAIAA